ncbi:MAG: hypothetical protein ABH860_04005 [bacterium]
MNGESRTFIQRNISPKITGLYLQLGYVHRGTLAGNLHQIKNISKFDAASVIHRLKQDGILKSRFDVGSLQDIQPFMLKATTLSKVEALSATEGLFPSSEATLKNIVNGLEAGAYTSSIGLLADKTPSGSTMAFLAGSVAAATIAATLMGFPSIAVSAAAVASSIAFPVVGVAGAGVVYGLVASYLIHKVDPHSLAGKLCKFGPLVLSLSAGALLLYGSYEAALSGNMLTGFVKKMLFPGVVAGLAATGLYTIRDVNRYKNTALADNRPRDDRYVRTSLLLDNFRLYGGGVYITYRTAFQLAWTFSTMAIMYSSGVLGMGVIGLSAGLTLNRLLGQKYKRIPISERVANFASFGSPILKVALEYTLKTAAKYGPVLALALPGAANPLGLFYDLATVYAGWLTLAYADFHYMFHSMMLAYNSKRSIFNVESDYVSDAIRHKFNVSCARLCAYIKDKDRNISKIINALIMESPAVEVELCIEGDPQAGLNAVNDLYEGRQVINKIVGPWMKNIYDQFHAGYKDLMDAHDTPQENEKAANALADIFEKEGKKFAYDKTNETDSYVSRIKGKIQEEKDWFNMTGEESYMREAYKAVKFRGLDFLDKAMKLRQNNKNITRERLKLEYLDMLGRYSVRFNHAPRKLDTSDPRFKTKTDNIGWWQTHRGDTLYMVWRLLRNGGETKFAGSYVPATWVRIDNPKFDHLESDRQENKRYIWIRRKDLLKILGLSQSSSNDLKLVDVTPGDAELKAHKEKIEIIRDLEKIGGVEVGTMEGFYSDREMLKPKKLIDWKDNEIKANKDTWIAGQDAPDGFKENFRAWARKHYGEDKYNEWALEKNNALWWIDAPEVLVLAPAEKYNISDENYIVDNTEREFNARLYQESLWRKLIRVPSLDRWSAVFPDLPGNRDPKKIKLVSYASSFIGLRYRAKDTDGVIREFNIPYDENRESAAGSIGSKWKKISYCLIKKDPATRKYFNEMEVYSKDNVKLGKVQTEWPHNMHPLGEVLSKDENGDIKIYMDVFSERVGKMTWLKADYGNNYGDKFHERVRYVPLDPDKEAKQMLVPEFISSIKYSRLGKGKIVVDGEITRYRTFPFDKKWSGIRWAEDVDVLEVDSSGDVFINPNTHAWSPRQEKGYVKADKKGLILFRDGDKESVFEVGDLPFMKIGNADAANKTIMVDVDKNELVFTILRSDNLIKDNPSYTYIMPRHLYDKPGMEAQNRYKEIAMLLDTEELTVDFIDKNSAYLYFENGERAKDRNGKEIILSMADFKDKNDKGFLQSPEFGMDSLKSFYRRSDGDYIGTGTEEYRPMLMKIEGKIALILTRIKEKRVSADKINPELMDAYKRAKAPSMFYAHPTCAVKIKNKASGQEKWVPLSLPRPFEYKPQLNLARVEINVGGKMTYLQIPVSKNLPPMTYFIEYDKTSGKFIPYTIVTEVKDNNSITNKYEKCAGGLGEEVQMEIRTALKENEVDPDKTDKVTMLISYTREPDLLNGEWHSLVSGQRQKGGEFADEMLPAVIQADLRDKRFYGIPRRKYSEAHPYGGQSRADGLQSGKGNDYDINGRYSAKPIENGTQYVSSYHHLHEMVEISLGLPKGALLSHAAWLDKSGGWEKSDHKPNFAKLTGHGGILGWQPGVSEDEQGVLAHAILLGLSLKYALISTAFESQPNTFNQVNKQDNERYLTAMDLYHSIVLRYEKGEIIKMFTGKDHEGTMKKKFEHFSAATWYMWPRAELIRQLSPSIFFMSMGNIKPYPVDINFLGIYLLDFISSVSMFTNFMRNLGYNKKQTSHNAFVWSLILGPGMNQAFHFSALRGLLEHQRKGWQFGAFVTTALVKATGVPPENKNFLRLLMGVQGTTFSVGALSLVPLAKLGLNPFTYGYFLNMFWTGVSFIQNGIGWRFIGKCEKETIEGEAESPKTAEYRRNRDEAIQANDNASEAYHFGFLTAYGLASRGKYAKARKVCEEILDRAKTDKRADMDYVLAAEEMLERLGPGEGEK